MNVWLLKLVTAVLLLHRLKEFLKSSHEGNINDTLKFLLGKEVFSDALVFKTLQDKLQYEKALPHLTVVLDIDHLYLNGVNIFRAESEKVPQDFEQELENNHYVEIEALKREIIEINRRKIESNRKFGEAVSCGLRLLLGISEQELENNCDDDVEIALK
jgi:hypothetical protein